MKLPKLISPCPIKEAVAEVRFEPKVPHDAVFGIIFRALESQLVAPAQELPFASLPAQLRENSELKFQAHFRLETSDCYLLVGPRVMAVAMKNDYPGWPNLSKSIKEKFKVFDESKIVKTTLRFGLRYINFFEFDVIEKLTWTVLLNDKPLRGEQTFFKTIVGNPSCQNLIQIGKGVALIGAPEKPGSIIDIDSFRDSPAGEFMVTLEGFLEEAHTSEKSLFFELLKPDFVATLNPVYEK